MPDATDHLKDAENCLLLASERLKSDHVGLHSLEYDLLCRSTIAHSLVSIAADVRLLITSLVCLTALQPTPLALGPCGCAEPEVQDGVKLCRRCNRNVIPNVKEQDDA